MTVNELIEELKKYPGDMLTVVEINPDGEDKEYIRTEVRRITVSGSQNIDLLVIKPMEIRI